MKKLFFLFAWTTILFSACSKDETPDIPIVDNYLVSATPTGVIQKELIQLALSIYPEFSDYAVLPKTNVNLIRVSYTTEYPEGEPITASGVFFVPDNYNAQFPTVVYTHGTITKAETPSLSIANPSSYTIEVLLCAGLSSAFNCAILMPDYVGYGESDEVVHPFLHAQSLGQASLDLIRAFREYTLKPEVDLSFNNRLLLTGYSEGGYAAVALQKQIQETAGSELQAGKTIAGAGAYDNVALAKEFLGKTSNLNSQFVSSYLWAISMYKTDYGYSKSYTDILSDTDNMLLQSSGYNMAYFATQQLALHTNPTLLFSPSFREGVLNETDTEFMQLLKANSLVDFSPLDSLIFVCGSADDWVYPVNTYNAYNTMMAKGCKVKMIEHPGGNHKTTMPVYLNILLGRLNMETSIK